MSSKRFFVILTILCILPSVIACKKDDLTRAQKAGIEAGSNYENNVSTGKDNSVEGDWFAQIDIPDNDLTILLEFNLMKNSECVVNCEWIDTESRSTEAKASGNATYRVINDNELEIKFLNEKERIREDNIFDMTNIYRFRMQDGKMIILDNSQFRNVDITFGKGFENRGISTITF